MLIERKDINLLCFNLIAGSNGDVLRQHMRFEAIANLQGAKTFETRWFEAKNKRNAFTTTTTPVPTSQPQFSTTISNNEAEEVVNIKVYILKII
jgi:hypothetical protein